MGAAEFARPVRARRPRAKRLVLSNLSARPAKAHAAVPAAAMGAGSVQSNDRGSAGSGLPDGLPAHFAMSVARASKPSHQRQLGSVWPSAVSIGTSAWPQPVQGVVRFMRFSTISAVQEWHFRRRSLRERYDGAGALRWTGALVPDSVEVAIHCDTAAMSSPLSR